MIWEEGKERREEWLSLFSPFICPLAWLKAVSLAPWWKGGIWWGKRACVSITIVPLSAAPQPVSVFGSCVQLDTPSHPRKKTRETIGGAISCEGQIILSSKTYISRTILLENNFLVDEYFLWDVVRRSFIFSATLAGNKLGSQSVSVVSRRSLNVLPLPFDDKYAPPAQLPNSRTNEEWTFFAGASKPNYGEESEPPSPAKNVPLLRPAHRDPIWVLFSPLVAKKIQVVMANWVVAGSFFLKISFSPILADDALSLPPHIFIRGRHNSRESLSSASATR